MSVNAHTQTPEDAANLVEYLNGTRHTMYAEMRRAHGHDAPYKVKYFGLGNEIYGNWQPGQKTAAEYAAWCAEAIRQMKDVDSEKAKDETLPSLLHFDAIPAVDAAVTIDDAAKRLNVSLIQKLEDRPLNVTLDLRGAALNTTAPVKISHLTRNGDIWVENTVDSPHNVGLATTTIPFTTHHTLAPASLTTLEYQLL